MARSNFFAQAVLDFIEELKAEDQQSRFYKEVLTEGSRLLLHGSSDAQSLDSAQILHSCIQELDNEQKRRGKTRWVGRKLQPLVNGLTQYTAALDVMIQAGPAPASLIYGGAKLVLQLAKGFTDYFEMMVDTLEEIGFMLECYHIFSRTYPSEDAMRFVMVNSYKNILGFWQKASRLFTRNGVKTFLKGIVKPFNSEWTTLRSRLEKDRVIVQAYAQAHEGEAAKRREETTERREIVKEEDKRNAKRMRLVAWLNSADDAGTIDVRDHLEPLLQAKHRGTCEWLFRDTKFSSWITSNENDNLWLHASPGTGKTVLCSSVVDKLKRQGSKVVYFFCSFQEPSRRKISSILRSLALQLLSLQPEIPTAIEALYDAEMHQGQMKLRNERVILQVVQALLRQIDRVHVVLDGLDECEDRDHALRLLTEICKFRPLGIVKWFWSSRLEREFEEVSQTLGFRKIEATKTQVQHDMKAFLEDSPDMAGNSDKSVDDWVSAADGNFLWLRLMLRTMTGCDLTCPAEIQEELAKFPTGLNGCYMRVLQQLLKKPPAHQRLARKLFVLIAFAAQPLTLCEVLDALAVKGDSQDYQTHNKPFEHVVKQLCCPLILLDTSRENGDKAVVLRYFHKSTRDFFMQHPDSLQVRDNVKQFFAIPEQGSLEMARTCMRYLSYNRYESPSGIDWSSNDFALDHCFARYAALYWYVHFHDAGYSIELYDSVNKFLRGSQFWTCLQVQAVVAPYLFSRLKNHGDNRFTMTGAQTYGPEAQDYFSSPLPSWLEDSETGQILLRSYTAFINEWHPLLLQHPKAVLECHPGVLGSHSIFALKGLTVRSDAVTPINAMHGVQEQSTTSQSEYRQTILASQATKTGLRLYTLDQKPLLGDHDQFLRQSHINLESGEASEGAMFKEKRIWKMDNPRADSILQLKPSDTPDQQAIWTWDGHTYTLTRHQGDKSTVFNAPAGISQALSMIKSNKLEASVQRHHIGCKTILTYDVLSNEGESSSDHSEYDDGDSDVSISKSGNETADGDSHCDTYLRILVVIDGDGEPRWFHWEQKCEVLLDYVPASHAKQPFVVWPMGKNELMLADVENSKAHRVRLLDGGVAQSSEIISRNLHFSSCGILLHCLTTTTDHTEDGFLTIYHLRLRTFSFDPSAKDSNEKLAERSNDVTISIDYTTQPADGHVNVLTSWTAKWVYVALSTPSSPCTIKMLRFPLPQQRDMADSVPRKVQTTTSLLYAPRSFPQRSPTFHTIHTPSNDHMALLLGSPQSKTSAAEIVAGPPILMRWTISQLGGWRDWDEKRDGREEGLDSTVTSRDHLKGQYAAAEQRFSVPIRSGLNWRKSCFVSCW